MTALEGAEFLDRRTRISEGFFDTPHLPHFNFVNMPGPYGGKTHRPTYRDDLAKIYGYNHLVLRISESLVYGKQFVSVHPPPLHVRK